MKRAVLVMLAVLATPEAAFACEKCFGGAEGPVGEGISMAMLALLGMTGFLWAGIGAFFINMRRRARQLAPGDLAVGEDGSVLPWKPEDHGPPHA